MNAQPDGTVAKARERIRDLGVAVQYVGMRDGVPPRPFAYTIGLTALSHPELLIVGLTREACTDILNTLASRVRGGVTLRPGDACLDLLPEDYALIIAGPVAAAADDGEYAIRVARDVFSETELPLPYQVVYPDAEGRFPWDPQYDLTIQPLLAPVPVRTVSAKGPWRARAARRCRRSTPVPWRWLHRLYARWGGFFWMPCPLCERPFGGHELRDTGGMPSMIPAAGGTPGVGQGICPACTRDGRGVRLSAAGDDAP